MQVVNQLRRQQLVLIGIVLLALQQEMQNGEMLDVLSKLLVLLVLGKLPLLLKNLDQFVKEMSKQHQHPHLHHPHRPVDQHVWKVEQLL